MAEHQTDLPLDVAYSTEPSLIPELRDEIARAWRLPLGQRVEVCFLGSQRAAVTGILELVSTPEFPWDPRQPLRLRIAGLVFGTGEIDRWTVV